MKKILAIVILLLNSFLSNAQSKTFIKLNELYKKDKPIKLIKKATKVNLKNKRDAIPYYFISLGNYSLFKKSNSNFNLNKSIYNLIKAKKYSYDNLYWNKLKSEFLPLQKSIEQNVVYYLKRNEKKALKMCEDHIVIFGDSIKLHNQFFVEKSLEKHNLKKSYLTKNWSEKRDSIKIFSNKFIGTPYRWAGENPSGFDCSGFVKYIYNYVGIKLPHNANKISYLGRKVSEKNAKTGDIILFGSTNENGHHAYHTGLIYENNDGDIKLIHSITSGVHITSDYGNYWKKRTLFIRNLIDYPINNDLVRCE